MSDSGAAARGCAVLVPAGCRRPAGSGSGRCSSPGWPLRRCRPSPGACCAAAKDYECEYIIRKTLEGVVLTALHPRTAVHVVVQVRGEARQPAGRA